MPVATATTKLTVDQKALRRGLKSGIASVRQYGKQVKETMLAVGKVIAGVGVIAGLLAANFIKAASDFEETRGKFTAVFKDLTSEASTFVDEMADSLGRSKTQLTDFMATLQDTFVPLGFARREGLAMSKTLVQLAIDLASFNNKVEAEVVRDLQSAIVGNVETLRKYGVIINQVSLNQEILNMGIAGGVKNATEAQKAQARLNILLAGTKDAQGDAARTSESFANQMRALQSAVENVRVELGTELLPLAKDVVVVLKDLAENSEEWLDPLAKMAINLAKVGVVLQQVGFRLFVVQLLRGSEATQKSLKRLREDWELLSNALDKDPPDPVGGLTAKAAKAEKEWQDEIAKIKGLWVDMQTALAKPTEVGDIMPPDLTQLQLTRGALLLPGDIPTLDDEVEDEAKKDAEEGERHLRPRFEGLEQAWERITLAASSLEEDTAKKTAEATVETAKESKKIAESTKKAEGFLAETTALLVSIDDKLELQAATFEE